MEDGKNENPAGWISISYNGEYLAGACPNSLNLFLKESNKPIWTYQTQEGNIYSPSISSDGKYLAVGTLELMK